VGAAETRPRRKQLLALHGHEVMGNLQIVGPSSTTAASTITRTYATRRSEAEDRAPQIEDNAMVCIINITTWSEG
jgi:hypothetical protein